LVEPGSRPAAGRPEGLALTLAVVVPGDRIMVVARLPGGAWLPSSMSQWRREGHGEPGFGPRCQSRWWQPACRVPGHTFVTPQRRVT
jgi:hypothetical protein